MKSRVSYSGDLPGERARPASGPSLQRNTAWALGAEVLRAGAGAGVVFGLALLLDQADIGRYAAVFAIANAAAMIGHVGAPFVFIRQRSRGGAAGEAFRRMMGTVLLGGLISSGLLIAAQPLLLDEVSLEVFALLAISRLLPFGLAEATVATATSERNQRFGFGLRSINTLGRLLPLGALAMMDEASLLDWALVSAVGFWVSALVMYVITATRFGLSTPPTAPRRQDLRQGVPLALKLGTGSLLTSVDRPVLVAQGLAIEAGEYSIGARVAELGQLPVMALVRVTSPDFFAAGEDGLAAVRRLAIRMTVPAALAGAAVGIALVVAAPVVPMMLGPDWEASVGVIRLLAPLPLLKAVQRFAANALTGADAPLTQFWALLVATAVNLVANLLLIPRIGLNGAIVSTLAAESLYAAMLWGLLERSVRLERAGSAESLTTTK